jgi:MAP/microtubule affinity-regulating kinase
LIAAVQLIRKFLVRDPSKRPSLEVFRDDPWINEGYDSSPIGEFIDFRILIDQSIVQIMMSKFNISSETVEHALANDLYNDVSAIYLLLADQQKIAMKEGGVHTTERILLPASSPAKG